MEKKIGVYICGGCGIGEAVDVEKLADMARSEFKAPVFIHPFLCGAEGMGQIRADIADGKVNAPVIAACSPRAKSEVFAFDPRTTVLDRVNLREQVAWSHEPSLAEGEEVRRGHPDARGRPVADGCRASAEHRPAGALHRPNSRSASSLSGAA